ncbi:DHA2 family efflux MFS transporter permease subunit [uncultured Jatrophihabitans sp.]|uniref:DHA2 family efflux MFS transporter permease subunit n=1 Tax=uncultured Jatrophihabitans sp. TaxID=1610747 RepID=UPI0035CB65B8
MASKADADTKAAQARAGSSDHRWRVLVVVSIAQLMVVLDATVVNIALPSAQADLGFENSQRQWVVTAYALAFGSLLLLGGRIGDIFGRKRTFLIALVAFAVASAIGGAAPSFAVLVIARALQGVAGAMLAPAALGTLVTTFRDPKDRGKAFGVFGTVAVAGGAVGLILGGVLTQYLSWRWCMYVNVLFAAAAIVGALVYMNEAKPPVRPRIDVVGTALAALGLFGLVLGFSRAESNGWGSGVTILSLAAGVVLLVAFVRVEQRVAHPLLPLRVVADRSRGMAFAAVGITGLAMFGLFLFLTYYLQVVKHLSPVDSGLAFLPMIVCVMISSNTSNIVTLPRFGPRVVITIGMTTGVLALLYLSRLDVDSSYATGVLPALMLMGFAMGMVMAPAMNTATAGVQPQDSGVAAALVSTMQQVGGSIGTAVLSTIAASATTAYASAHAPVRGFDAVAATHGYVTVFLVSALVFAVGGVLAAAFFPSKARLTAMRASAASSAATPQAEPASAGEPVAVDA